MPPERTHGRRMAQRMLAFATVLIAFAITGFVLAAQESPARVDQFVAEPDPLPTPLPSHLREATPQGTPSQGPPDSAFPWIDSQPRFANHILHWVSEGTQLSRNFGSGAVIEQYMRGEFWVEVNADGRISRLHEVFTDEHGTVYQESIYFPGGGFTTWGVGTMPLASEDACMQVGRSPSPPNPLPGFLVDAHTLAELGFVLGEAITFDVPVSDAVDGAFPSPVDVYETVSPAPTWRSVDTRTPGHTIYREISVDQSSRIVGASGRSLRDDGALLDANTFTFGDLYVFAPEAVPDSVFEHIALPADPCRP